MSGPVIGEDGVPVARGAAARAMRDYHDTEWGTRVHGESAYFERLTLEAFQSGLSWSTILNKREAFREVFAGFDADTVAAYDESDALRLMADPGSCATGGRSTRPSSTPGRPWPCARTVGSRSSCAASGPTRRRPPRRPGTGDDVTGVDRALQGVEEAGTFVGPTTMFALMEALDLRPHLVGCHRRGRGTIDA